MRRLLLAPLLALLLVFAACGGGGDGGSGAFGTGGNGDGEATESPQTAVLAAAGATAEAGSYRSTFEIEFRGLGDEPVSMRGDGLFEPPRGRITFDMSALGALAGQDLGEADFIFDSDVVFMRFPAIAGRLPGLKEWIRFDLRDLAGQLGTDLGQLSQVSQSDPSAALEYLRAASEDVEEVGEDEVRGEPTTHYRLTVDLERVAASSPGQRANLRKLLDQAGIREVPAEVWVDEQDRVRRLTLAYGNMRTQGGSALDMTMTTELYDFGVDFSVQPPPPGRVTDIGDFFGRGAEETEHTEPEGG